MLRSYVQEGMQILSFRKVLKEPHNFTEPTGDSFVNKKESS